MARDEHMTRREPLEPRRSRTSVVLGAVWMVVISLVLFFLPAINGLIGGLVGGYKVGSAGRALVAAILPAVIVGVGFWILLAAVGVPIWGIFGGLAIGLLIALSELGLFVGALLGGWYARTRTA